MTFDVKVARTEATYEIDGEPPDGAMVALITPVADGMSEPIEAQHLTLDYLGKAADITQEQRTEYVQRVVEVLESFGVPELVANGVGYLGPKRARVVFVETAPFDDIGYDGDGPTTISELRTNIAGATYEQFADTDLWGSVVRHDPFLAHITTGYDGGLLEIEPGTPIPVMGVRIAFGTEIYDITVGVSAVEASAKTGIGVLDALTVRADALLSELSNRVSTVEAMRGIRP